jgi:hypothetical protein
MVNWVFSLLHSGQYTDFRKDYKCNILVTRDKETPCPKLKRREGLPLGLAFSLEYFLLSNIMRFIQ